MDDFQKLLLETFAEEARDTVQALEKALLALEGAEALVAREEQFAILARRAHNLKGAAGAAGVAEIQSLSHALEDSLLLLRETDEIPSPEQFDLLYAGVDTIRMVGEGDEMLRPTQDTLDRLEASLRNIMHGDGGPLMEPAGEVIDTPAPLPPLPDVSLTPPPAPVAAAPSPPTPIAAAPSPPTPIAAAPSPVTAAPFPVATTPPPAEAETVTLPDRRPGGSVAPASKTLPYRSLQKEEGGESRKSSEPQQHTPMVRVSVDKLNTLMNQIGEIITVSKKTEVRLVEMKEIEQQMERLGAQLESFKTPLERLMVHTQYERGQDLYELLDRVTNTQKTLEDRFTRFHQQAIRDATTESLLTERLPEDIKRLRMRPFVALEDNMRRTIRDVSRRCDKPINLIFKGLDTEADQGVLDAIRDPLLHLLRNSVDHGIEKPEHRLANGKPAEGQVTIAFEGRSATLLIRVSDDGAGIDPNRLREQIRARNLIPENQLAQMNDKEVIDLIFLPGFSTASSVGLVSGRGIGMDVVRQVIQQHHGTVRVDTEIGKGTSFEMTMPLTFATVQGIIVDVLGHQVAIPIYALERLVRVSRNEIRYIEGAPTVNIDEEPLSLTNLSELLDLPPLTQTNLDEEWDDDPVYHTPGQSLLNAAIIKTGDRRIAFIVDDFIGESEMVVKDLPEALGRVPNVSGATITWSGEVMVILNPSDLIESALRQHSGGRADINWNLDAPTSRRILVCDDSLTTRTLEKNILIAAGYEVEDATNGLEALQLLEVRDFQLIVLDVDMPELSGFELTQRLRSQGAYRDIPIILVTSRDAEEDKRRGLAAGADAYITKQAFTQRTFLEIVRRFLE